MSTWAGLATALAQYLGALALFLEADDQALALGPLATATATLLTVLYGRFRQATAAIENQPASVAVGYLPASGTTSNVTWSSPRPGVEMTNPPPLGLTGVARRPKPAKRDPYADSVPAGSVPAEDGQ